MSVFLRWGIFGILGVAALIYAYNASKHMAEKRASATPVADAPAASTATPAMEAAPDAGPLETAPRCDAELRVAQHALEARGQGEPLDRLLRSQEIAFQDPPLRERLARVATRWFELEGDAPDAESLRAAVVSDCEKAVP